MYEEPEANDKEKDQSVVKPESLQSSPTKKKAKGNSPLKKMFKLKERVQGELFDAAIETVATAQHAVMKHFLLH